MFTIFFIHIVILFYKHKNVFSTQKATKKSQKKKLFEIPTRKEMSELPLFS